MTTIPAQRSPLALAQARRAEYAADLARAADLVRVLHAVGEEPTEQQLDRVKATRAAYDTATAQVRALTRGGVA